MMVEHLIKQAMLHLSGNKRLILTWIILQAFFLSIGYAQLPKREYVKKLREADKKFEYGDYRSALKIYREIYPTKGEDKDLAFKIGVSMFHLKHEKANALEYFERAGHDNIEVQYYKANLYHLQSRFNEALQAFYNYKSYPSDKEFTNDEIDYLIQKTLTAVELTGAPFNMSIENAGAVINSEYPDYVPLISADQSIMIFTSRRKESTGGLTDPNGEYFEDIYIAKKINGAWQNPVGISNNINTSTHDACVGLAAGGEHLFVYRTNKDGTAGDIYLSKFDGHDWSVPELLGSDINTEKYVEPSASISADEQILYFSSNRPGGFGGMDLYKVVKLPDGSWSLATNLGPKVNTPYDDDAPFIHPDGKKLYFSSKGHKNMGGYDVFRSEMDVDGHWGDATNLGSPVNSVDDDIYFVLSVNGDVGYYSSNKTAGQGSTDIYMIRMPEENFDLAVISGKATAEDGTPIASTITLINESGEGSAGIYRSNRSTGKFILIVSRNRKYKVLAEAEGYYPETYEISDPDQDLKISLHPKSIKP